MARDVTFAPAMLVNTDPACMALTDAAAGGGASGLKAVRLHSHSVRSAHARRPAVVARVGGALGNGRDRDRVPRTSCALGLSGNSERRRLWAESPA